MSDLVAELPPVLAGEVEQQVGIRRLKPETIAVGRERARGLAQELVRQHIGEVLEEVSELVPDRLQGEEGDWEPLFQAVAERAKYYDETHRAVVFREGPLVLSDLTVGEQARSFLMPVELLSTDEAETRRAYMQVAFVNCRPEHIPDEVEVVGVTAAKFDVKLQNSQEPGVRQLQELLREDDGKARIIISEELSGTPYFPVVKDPVHLPDADELGEHLTRTADLLGVDDKLQVDTEQIERTLSRLEFREWVDLNDVLVGEPVTVERHGKPILVYDVVSPLEPWQHLYLYTNQPLDRMNKRHLTNPDDPESYMEIRADSGCDTCMRWGDKSCDCHAQLLQTVDRMLDREDPMVILEVDSHDGAGWGSVVHLATDRKKLEGVPLAQAYAEVTGLGVGETDLRTYLGVGKVLERLGFTQVTVLTENTKKVLGLETAGLQVRVRTEGVKGEAQSQIGQWNVAEKSKQPEYRQE